MITIYRRLLYEPAVFIGLLASCLVVVFNLIDHNSINRQDILEIILPLATGTAVRSKTVSKKHYKETKNV